jgi:hypothetical protein
LFEKKELKINAGQQERLLLWHLHYNATLAGMQKAFQQYKK